MGEKVKIATIQHLEFFVILAFSGDQKGAAEMPESHRRLVLWKDIPVFISHKILFLKPRIHTDATRMGLSMRLDEMICVNTCGLCSFSQ
ncbi:MAG: hypothetical protein Q9P14_01290 [candidate division KSB1 bacterium]|nr:hypothetical protein [candidate division KSB1 bacterium]